MDGALFFAILLIIIGVVMIIVGIVIHERDISNGNSSIPWWIWFLWFGGLVIAIIGGIWVAWIYHKKGKQKSVPPGTVYQAKPVAAPATVTVAAPAAVVPAAVTPINNPVVPAAPAPTVQTFVQPVPQPQYIPVQQPQYITVQQPQPQYTLQPQPQQISLTPLQSTLVQTQAPPVQQPTSVTANVVQVPQPISYPQSVQISQPQVLVR